MSCNIEGCENNAVAESITLGKLCAEHIKDAIEEEYYSEEDFTPISGIELDGEYFKITKERISTHIETQTIVR